MRSGLYETLLRVCLAQVERHSLYLHLTAADNVLQLCTPSLLNICCWLIRVRTGLSAKALLRALYSSCLSLIVCSARSKGWALSIGHCLRTMYASWLRNFFL
jgi:hypothetical protein